MTGKHKPQRRRRRAPSEPSPTDRDIADALWFLETHTRGVDDVAVSVEELDKLKWIIRKLSATSEVAVAVEDDPAFQEEIRRYQNSINDLETKLATLRAKVSTTAYETARERERLHEELDQVRAAATETETYRAKLRQVGLMNKALMRETDLANQEVERRRRAMDDAAVAIGALREVVAVVTTALDALEGDIGDEPARP